LAEYVNESRRVPALCTGAQYEKRRDRAEEDHDMPRFESDHYREKNEREDGRLQRRDPAGGNIRVIERVTCC
jgi:hypothetical protein